LRLRREINLRIYQLVREFEGPSEFLCECGRPTCQEVALRLRPEEFAAVLALPDWFLVAPGHVPAHAAAIREYGECLLTCVQPNELTA
jgi:hypothetical protein